MIMGNSADQVDRGQYMHSANGQKIYPFDPRPEEIDIKVVAHHLATIGRWNGATRHKLFPWRIFFSVAEHSVLVSKFIEKVLGRPDLAMAGLLHDAPEYAVGDVIRPIKYSPTIYPVYKEIEDKNELAVCKRFKLPYPPPYEVKMADEAVCAAEFRQIVPRSKREQWSDHMMHDDCVVAPYSIQMMTPFRAKHFFLRRYRHLCRLQGDPTRAL